MCLRWSKRFVGLALVGGSLVASSASPATGAASESGEAPRRVLRVAADPNNLPFTNVREEGFENRLAELVARELHAELRYVWRPQRRGFVRNTLKAGEADLIMGVPAGYDPVLTTRPYYRSTYVFVSRAEQQLAIASLDDAVLRERLVGVQIIGDDFANIPPAHSLSARSIVNNVRGYTVYGDYAEENPPARIVRAVAAGEIDVAIVWGPLAGFFAARESVPLTLTPVPADPLLPMLPFTYAIAMGVDRTNPALRGELNAILERCQEEIEAILNEHHVPRATAPPGVERVGHVGR